MLARIGIDLLFGVVAYVIMIAAAVRQGRSQELVGPWWLVACFVALTVGELLVYPLCITLVTRLAPPTASAAAMGLCLWMATVAGGQWLAGEVAAHWSMWSHAVLFLVLHWRSLPSSYWQWPLVRSVVRWPIMTKQTKAVAPPRSEEPAAIALSPQSQWTPLADAKDNATPAKPNTHPADVMPVMC